MKERISRFTNIQKAYFVTSFSALYFIGPILVLFYQHNLLSYTQIFLLQSWYTFLIFVLEIPSGAVADLFKRRSVLIFSLSFFVLGYAAYSLSYSFWGFLIGETLWAVGESFKSGTAEAFIFDSLKEIKKEDEAKQVYANLEAISMAGIAVSCFVGSFIADTFGFRSVFYLTCGGACVAWAIQLSYEEPHHEKKKFSLPNFTNQIKESLKAIFLAKSLSALMFNSAVIAGILVSIGWYFQPHMKASGIPLVFFGAIYAGVCLSSALLLRQIPKLESRLGASRTLFFSDICAVVAVFCFSLFLTPAVSIVCIFVIALVKAARTALFNDYLNRFITSDKRATVISMNHFFVSLVFTVLGPISGIISDTFSFSHTIFGLGIVLLISVFVLRIGEGVIE